jgi:hypothetical protein
MLKEANLSKQKNNYRVNETDLTYSEHQLLRTNERKKGPKK